MKKAKLIITALLYLLLVSCSNDFEYDSVFDNYECFPIGTSWDEVDIRSHTQVFYKVVSDTVMNRQHYKLLHVKTGVSYEGHHLDKTFAMREYKGRIFLYDYLRYPFGGDEIIYDFNKQNFYNAQRVLNDGQVYEVRQQDGHLYEIKKIGIVLNERGPWFWGVQNHSVEGINRSVSFRLHRFVRNGTLIYIDHELDSYYEYNN